MHKGIQLFHVFTYIRLKSPKKEINVYLQPLIKELKELWSDGVRTCNCMRKEFFQVRAFCCALLMTFLLPGTCQDEVPKVIKHVRF